MNDNFTNDERNEIIAQKLSHVAEQTNARSQFAAELEEKLRAAHRPKVSRVAALFRQVSPTLRWVALMILLALVLSWSIKTLIPAPQPGADNTLTGTATFLPTTLPTGTPIPPFDYTVREGDTCGSIAQTFGVSLKSIVILNNLPSTCMISVGQTLKIPYPTPETNATPVTQEGGYDFRGAKLYLETPLPESPAEAHVYLLKQDEPATFEQARALADRFGIEGEVYQAPGELPDTNSYMITDGKQRLYIRSQNYFTYYAEYSTNTALLGAKDLSDEDARIAIDSFLKAHGFEFDYQIQKEDSVPGQYYVIRLTPDGRAIRFDYNMPSRMGITLGSAGQVIYLDSNQIDYEAVGAYGIHSAEEAFQQVLGNANAIQNGVLESSRSGGALNESYWERSYPDNQTITIYGRVTSFDSTDPGKPPFVSINSYTATGNTPPASDDQLIEATGHFYTENGTRKFNVDSWKISSAVETSVMGTLQREGDQTVLISDMSEKYVIPDAPADVPLNTIPPDEQLMVGGFLADGNLVWTTIQYFPMGSNFGGGGGGGGTGFYQLNLSGTPVPFPTPTMQPETGQGTSEYLVQEGDTCGNIASNFGISVQSLIDANQLSTDCIIRVGQALTIPGAPAQSSLAGQQLEKQRGTLSINIYKQQDGTSRPEFTYITQVGDTYLYATLENLTLDEMLPYQNRPIDIWGTIKSADAYGTAVISVDKAEPAYPGLEFQLIKGTQKNSEVDGNPIVLFTAEDGKAYVQMTRDGGLDSSIAGEIGDPVMAEALIIPDQTFSGYPVMEIFGIGIATNPKNGEPSPMTITADQPQVIDASLDPQTYTPPDTLIENVELVYYIPDPRYVKPETVTGPQYIQPAWRFSGHNSNGDVFEILVQALKQEFLLPELQTYTPPG